MDKPFGEKLREADPDRYLTALFAPAEKRAALMTLYAFNHEIARARDVVSEPMLALIRLQWWREVVEGEPRRHEVATPLAEAIAAGDFLPADLLAMIAGRELEAEPSMPDLAMFHGYLDATAGRLMIAAGRLLGMERPERLALLGRAHGLAGQLRRVPSLAKRGRCQLPENVLHAHGLTIHEVIADPATPRLRPVRRELAAEGSRWLDRVQLHLSRAQVSAALPAVLARRDLRRPERPAGPRGLPDKLAVVFAAWRGRM